jgi:hypothetical protein
MNMIFQREFNLTHAELNVKKEGHWCPSATKITDPQENIEIEPFERKL